MLSLQIVLVFCLKQDLLGVLIGPIGRYEPFLGKRPLQFGNFDLDDLSLGLFGCVGKIFDGLERHLIHVFDAIFFVFIIITNLSSYEGLFNGKSML